VFYFFQRERDTVTCEMRPAVSGSGYDIIIMKPGAPVVTEHHETMQAMHARWLELQEQFRGEGWWGPSATHDPR
jgi:hypothetical protein